MSQLKMLEELKRGDVIQLSSEKRVVLFTKLLGKQKGYCYARLSERGDTWDVEPSGLFETQKNIRGHGHDFFSRVLGKRAFAVIGSVLTSN